MQRSIDLKGVSSEILSASYGGSGVGDIPAVSAVPNLSTPRAGGRGRTFSMEGGGSGGAEGQTPINIMTPRRGGAEGGGGAFFNSDDSPKGLRTMLMMCPIQSEGDVVGFLRIVKLARRRMVFEGTEGEIGWEEGGEVGGFSAIENR